MLQLYHGERMADKALLVSEIFCHFWRPFLVDNILVDNKNMARAVTHIL